MNIKKQQSGFTLIELVVVIVILGILAATAIPKFIDLSGEAEQAATEGVAGAVSSGSSINYAARLAGNTTDTIAVATCGAALALSIGHGADYTITTDAATATPNGEATACTVEGPNGATAIAQVIGAT